MQRDEGGIVHGIKPHLMKTRAAILVELGRPLELVDLDVPALKPGQVLVEIAHSGVCHTQVLEARGHRGEDRFLPHCLGHEGSGVVREIGAGVSKVRAGDRVILSWIKGAGADVPGTTYAWNGRTVNAGGVTTFSDLAVVSENRLTLLPGGVAMRAAALLGCAIPTGVGAVLNAGRALPGQSAVIFGCGGVGLCAVIGAVVAGCTPIVAVDLRAEKLNIAKRAGATHVVNAATETIQERLKQICPAGFDLAIEATGRPAVMKQALECVRPRGGVAVVIGNARFGEQLEIDPQQLNQGKRLLGTWGGDCVPDRDYPRFANLLRDAHLDWSPIIGGTENRFTLDKVNDALDELESARLVRPILDIRAASHLELAETPCVETGRSA